MLRHNYHRRGQAVVEMAIFASVILLALGVLVAYIQKLNDQQLAKMDSFRRALVRANTYQGAESESPGASVQFFLVQDRRHADVNGEFGKGTTQTLSADASVFWAIPTEEAYADGAGSSNSEDLVIAKVNDDEIKNDDTPLANNLSLEAEADLEFQEDYLKTQNRGVIANRRDSQRKEKMYTYIPDTYGVTQYSYRDPWGQYRYSREVPGERRTVEREKIWTTAE